MRGIVTPMHLGVHNFECEKICYPNRKTAKRAARFFRGDHLSPYRCPKNPSHFHIGHLAPPVLTGRTTRDRYYQGLPMGSEHEGQGSI